MRESGQIVMILANNGKIKSTTFPSNNRSKMKTRINANS